MEFQNICFQYGKHKVLNEISFPVPEGKCTGIIGANGCGKSTLLSVIAGARKAKTGTLKISNPDASFPLNQLRRPEFFGYIPQDNPFIEQLSAYDNLLLWYKGKKSDFNQVLESDMIKRLGVNDFLKKNVNQLSGGMKKRLSIASSLINQPSVLILDEPSAALDIPCKIEIHDYLAAYLEKGGTVIITTHEPDELDLCQQLLVIHDGTIGSIDPTLRGKDLTCHF